MKGPPEGPLSGAAPSALRSLRAYSPRAYARGYPGAGASRLIIHQRHCPCPQRRRRHTLVAPAVRGRPTVGFGQAPKARSISAWGNTPGSKVQLDNRAVSPPYTSLWSGLSALPSSQNSYSWGVAPGVAPGWYGAGLQPATIQPLDLVRPGFGILLHLSAEGAAPTHPGTAEPFRVLPP